MPVGPGTNRAERGNLGVGEDPERSLTPEPQIREDSGDLPIPPEPGGPHDETMTTPHDEQHDLDADNGRNEDDAGPPPPHPAAPASP